MEIGECNQSSRHGIYISMECVLLGQIILPWCSAQPHVTNLHLSVCTCHHVAIHNTRGGRGAEQEIAFLFNFIVSSD